MKGRSMRDGYICNKFLNWSIKLCISKEGLLLTNPPKISNQLPLQYHPSPRYPGSHVQLYELSVLLQNALKSQLWVSALLHSSMSEIILINSKN